MKKPRIYVDTSVIGGCCDPEFEEWSKGLLRDFQEGRFQLLLSSTTEFEIKRAPEKIQKVYKEFKACESEFIIWSDEAVMLADQYLKHGILPPKFSYDARHIALATVAKADLLVSWNFRHVVNFAKIRQFNAVNLEMGYSMIAIHSPQEVTTYGRKGRCNCEKN
jgi:predicted nucleic acid-binding protein